jgi:regulator of sigma E protease
LSIIGVSDPAGPAADAGLRSFDWVVAAAGKPTRRWSELSRVLDHNRGSLVPLTVLRPERAPHALGDLLGVSVYAPRVATLTPEPGDASGRTRAGLEPADLYVSYVAKGSGEARAGVQSGDRIVALDGRPVRHFSAFIELLEAEQGKQHTLTVRRQGGLHDLHYTLSRQRALNDYEKPHERYMVGLRRHAPTMPHANVPNPAPVSYALSEAPPAKSSSSLQSPSCAFYKVG